MQVAGALILVTLSLGSGCANPGGCFGGGGGYGQPQPYAPYNAYPYSTPGTFQPAPTTFGTPMVPPAGAPVGSPGMVPPGGFNNGVPAGAPPFGTMPPNYGGQPGYYGQPGGTPIFGR
jgi:hypothetical protein